ncbi:hypothetical protein PRI8871_03869 [Pseudoprimorskyibacter insulae]|uniref:Uncharacterized protein n=1 Tax=Pseudoprimorskyibacter insulae TaxID=1695997 RepID=A0A2R8B1A2_9RHOB|nr:hypothetical protein PRI8871_03869 [Pseudoprimorskyibacter insulae]
MALLVAKDLHLDVAGADDHLFQISLAVAKGGLGLTTTFQNLFLQLFGAVDRAHAPAAAAPAGLQHQRIADFLGLLRDGVPIVAQNFGRRNDRNPRLNRDFTRAGLVAQLAHGRGLGADKGDARRVASIDKFRVFRQQTIARMNRIRTAFLGHADDLGNAQIRRNRPKPRPNPIRLIRLETVEAKLVLLSVNGNGLLSHLVRSAKDADRNLTTVGN